MIGTANAVFPDVVRDCAFARDGYVVIDLFSPDQIARFRAVFDGFADRYQGGFSATMLQPDPEHRHSVHRQLSEIAGPAVTSPFCDYRVVYWGFAIKCSEDPRAMPLHQDITLVAEGGRRGISIWAPLVDVTPENGCLEVVPGSHRLNDYPRAPGTPFPCPELESRIRSGHLRAIPLSAGRAVILDHATFHSSPPNSRPAPRVAVAAVVAPAEQSLCYYHRTPTAGGAVLEKFAVGDDFYLSHTIGTLPTAARRLSIEPERVAHIPADHLDQLPND